MQLYSFKTQDMNTFKKVIDVNVYGSVIVAKYAVLMTAKNSVCNNDKDREISKIEIIVFDFRPFDSS